MRARPSLLVALVSVWSGGCVGSAVAPSVWPASGCEAGGAGEDPVAYRRRTRNVSTNDGISLAVGLLEPRRLDCTDAVVLVAPGLLEGVPVLRDPFAESLVADGMTVVAFDARGRGDSDGEEDGNGRLGQDDLASVMRWTAALDFVDPDGVILYSRSLGGAAAAGALARHADLRPVAWVDWESPADLAADAERAGGQAATTLAALAEDSGDADTWYAERDPVGNIGGVTVPYRRLQGLPDHELGMYVGAAVSMVAAAGAAPERWYNGEQVDGELRDAEARDRAVAGGLDGTSDEVVADLQAALQR